MDIENNEKQIIEETKKEIKDILSKISSIKGKAKINKFDKNDREELEILYADCVEIDSKLKELEQEKDEKEHKIKEAQQKQKRARLVPMEEIEPEYQELMKRYDDIKNFLKSEERKEFSKEYKKINAIIHISIIKEAIKEVKEESDAKKQEEKKQLREKMEDMKKLILEPEEAKGVAIIGQYPVEDPDSHNLAYSVKYNKVVEGYTSEKFSKLPIFPDCVRHVSLKLEEHVHDDGRSPIIKREYCSKASFKAYEDCTLEQKQGCKEVEKKIEKIKNSKNEKYDKPGTVSLWMTHGSVGEYLKIECTQRQLAIAGLLPKEMRWKKSIRIFPKDIADSSKALTTTEVGGVKGFFAKMLDKAKGKGEK